jgi:hypothetical protein
MFNFYKLIQLSKNPFEIVSWLQQIILNYYKLKQLFKNPFEILSWLH